MEGCGCDVFHLIFSRFEFPVMNLFKPVDYVRNLRIV